MHYYDLAVCGARDHWEEIRWALFVFPDIRDVQPTDAPEVVRIFHESERPHPEVWRVQLAQEGFDVPSASADERSPE